LSSDGLQETVSVVHIVERNLFLERQNRELKLSVQRLRRAAFVDSLTGLANRRYFEMSLNSELRRAARAHKPLALAVCDIDHFKRFNDTFGHQCGDTVLRKVAAAFQPCCRRAGDVAARYGGEEFALLLPGLEAWRTLAIVERLRQRVAQLSLSKDDPAMEGITISIGITTFHDTVAPPPSTVMHAADMALYRAKESGRNRTKFQAIA
jgi:diguanylate cyclase